MEHFKIPQYVTNPEIKEDVKNLYPTLPEEKYELLLSGKNKAIISGIVDRIEFIHKLGKLHELLLKRRTFGEYHFEKINIDGKECFECTLSEKIDFEGIEFNGFNYDIEALILYLQTTIIEHIAGLIINDNNESYDFLIWLRKNTSEESYTIDEIDSLNRKHKDLTGTRRLFIKIFNEISKELKDRIVRNLVITKIGLAGVEKKSYARWVAYSADEKIKKIAEYLYDQVRCPYTHSMIRTLSNNRKITSSKPINKNILVVTENENVFDIINSMIIEIFSKLCDLLLSKPQ